MRLGRLNTNTYQCAYITTESACEQCPPSYQGLPLYDEMVTPKGESPTMWSPCGSGSSSSEGAPDWYLDVWLKSKGPDYWWCVKEKSNFEDPCVSLSLLLHLDDGFTDSSPNNLQITAGGNPQINTTEGRFGGGCLYLDGNSYLRTEDSPIAELRTGDFTVEAWIKTSSSDEQVVVSMWDCDSAQFLMKVKNYQAMVTWLNNNFVDQTFYGGGINPGEWTHYALTRSGNTIRVFLNGSEVINFSGTTSPQPASTAIQIGKESNCYSANFFNGYIDELRVIKGEAVYKAEFNAPNLPFVVKNNSSSSSSSGPGSGQQCTCILQSEINTTVHEICGGPYLQKQECETKYCLPNLTQLLVHFDDTSKTDNEATLYLDFEDGLKNKGYAPLCVEVDPTNPAEIIGKDDNLPSNSAYFNGSSYLTTPFSDDFAFGSGDFTVEGWVYWEEPGEAFIIAAGSRSDQIVWGLKVSSIEDYYYNYVYKGVYWISPYFQLSVNYDFSTNNWYHIAVCRKAGMLRIFVNGTVVESGNDSSNYEAIGYGEENSINIGKMKVWDPWWGYLQDQFFNGYMDEIRVSKGQGFYSANFSPSTSPSSSNSSLMLRFNEDIGDLNFIDSSQNQLQITNNGNVAITKGPRISRNGLGSGYFNQSSIYVKTNPILSLGTSDFTIETWVRMKNWGNGYATLYDGLAPGGNYYRTNCFCWALLQNSNNNTSGVYYNGQWHNFNAYVSIVLNSWSHHALVRRENFLYWYVDGNLLAMMPFDLDCSSPNCVIGRASDQQVNFFNGYLDDYRITKTAKYENLHFLPPESAFEGDFPQYSYSLLMHFDGSFAVQSQQNLSVSVNGSAEISSIKSKFGGSSAKFNGYSDSIVINGSSFVKFELNDFTIEGWLNIDQSQNSFQYILEGPQGYLYFYKSGGYDGLYHSSLPQASFPIEDNSWNHFALVRRKKITSLYVNGILVSSGVDNNNYSSGTSFRLGNNYYQYQGMYGYMDEFRISNREALYEGSFGVPDDSFLYDLSIPSLIIYFDGDINDYSPNQISTSMHGGGVSITSDESKWGEQSVYFGDLSVFPSSYIDAVDSNNALSFASQDFTIECWFRPTTYASPNAYQAIFSGRQDFTYGVMMDQQGYLRMWLSSSGWYWDLANEHGYLNDKVVLNNWNHVCMVRSGGIFSIYLNGKNVGQKYTQYNVTINSGTGLRIGSWGNGQYGINKGYINEVRVIKGEALYMCSFEPPQSGFYEPSSSSSSSSSNPTSLMLHMDGFISDESGFGTKVIPRGNLKTNALNKKFGEQSAYFDGESHLEMASDSQALSFGNQDFTIEFWMYSTRNYQEKIITTQSTGFFIQKKYGNRIELVINSHSYTTPEPVVVQNSWQHVALSRENGVFRLFVSGNIVMEVDSEITYSIPNILNIGKDTTYLYQYPFEGYLDEIRATKGLALYTQNFQEPTQAFSVSRKSEISQKTSLLMHFRGQDQSINFVDSGPNKLTFDEGNYNYARIKTSRKVFGESSGFFDGNSYLKTASNDGFDFGLGDFTIEAWVYLESNYQNNFILGASDNSSWYFGFNQNNQFGLGFGRRDIGWDIVDASGPFPVNVWQHVAVCRKGGIIRLFVNGQKVAESSNSISYSNQAISIGGGWDYGNMHGYLDEVRIVKNLGIYEENFAVPSEEYFETNCDVVLLHFDGQNGETKFKNSASGLFVSHVGSVSLSDEKSKFGPTSAKFNGNGDRLDIEGSKLLFLENEDYTVECFVYITDWGGPDHARIWSFQYEQSWYYYNYENWSLLVLNDGTGTLYLNKLGTYEGIMTPPGVVSLNEWAHIALTRQGNLRCLYVNGRLVGSYGQRCLPDPIYRQAVCRLSLGGSIGTYYGYYSYSNFKGYIDEFRVTKGLARYKNQSVLIDTSSQTIVDSSPNQIAIKSNGVEVTNEQSKFGGYSGHFSGGQDFLEMDDENLAFGKNDFTIEFWIRPTSYPKSTILATGRKAGDFYNSGFALGPSNFHGGLRLYDDYNNDILSCESCLLLNQWAHVAIVRHNYSLKLYVSGNMASSSYSEDDFTSSKFIFGIDPAAPSLSFNGYVDDLRIVSAAVYKSNFVPPDNKNDDYLPAIGDQVYCIPLIDYDANIHEICGGPYYSKDQCGSCNSSSSSSGSSSSSSAEIACFPIVSIVDMPDGSKAVDVICSDQPASSSSSFCIPEVPPSEDIICPDGRQVGKTYYLPNFADCSWVAYHDIYGVCDGSSSSSSSSFDCHEQVRHCLYSDFSLGTSLFALEDKPPPCTYRTYCLPEGCVEICETEGSTPISSCDPACCTPGSCLLDCSTSVAVSNCIACGLLGGMWFSTSELLSAYLDQNCNLKCWSCSDDENNECSPITISGQYTYPKNWTWTGQKEITCEDLGHYADEGACADDCCDCYCGTSSCANTSHETIEELAADCGDCCASSGGGIIVHG